MDSNQSSSSSDNMAQGTAADAIAYIVLLILTYSCNVATSAY